MRCFRRSAALAAARASARRRRRPWPAARGGCGIGQLHLRDAQLFEGRPVDAGAASNSRPWRRAARACSRIGFNSARAAVAIATSCSFCCGVPPRP
jgi:hypothetical protein